MSDTFILELPLQTSPRDEKILEKSLAAGALIYNASLSELFKRFSRFKESCAYQKARTLPKSKEQTAVLRTLEQQFGLTGYGIEGFSLKQRKKIWFRECIDAPTAQAIAQKAFISFREWRFGKKGRPRFKQKIDLGHSKVKVMRQELSTEAALSVGMISKLNVCLIQKTSMAYKLTP